MENQDVLIDIRERLVRVETKLDDYNQMRGRVDRLETSTTETEAKSKSNTYRITAIEENSEWLWRTFAGALIVGVITLYFVR